MSVRLLSPTMSTGLKARSDIHLARKVWHFLGVTCVLVIYHNVSRPVALQLLTLVGSFVIFCDLYRLKSAWFNKIFVRIFGALMRDSEQKTLLGSTYMAIGVFICVALFPPLVVKLSLIFLAVADPLASYFGIRYGKDRLFGNKSLQGSTAAFVSCSLVSAIYFLSKGIMVERLLIASLLSGLVGAISEGVPVGKLDDNLVMPIVSSTLLMLLFLVLGGF